jgi:hypothetical protein
MIVGTVTLDRRALYPIKIEQERIQNVFSDGDGNVRIRDRGRPAAFYTYKVNGLSQTNFNALKAYLVDVANFKMNTLLVVDDMAVAGLFRWWDKSLKYTVTMGGLYNVTMKFRKESI